MRDLLTRLAEMIEEIIIEAEDEPQFTTREHATTGAEEMYRELIMPVLAEAWDEGFANKEQGVEPRNPGRDRRTTMTDHTPTTEQVRDCYIPKRTLERLGLLELATATKDSEAEGQDDLNPSKSMGIGTRGATNE